MTQHRWPDMFGEQLAHPEGLTQLSVLAREGLVITWSAHPLLPGHHQLVIEQFVLEPQEGPAIFSMTVFNGQLSAPIIYASLHRQEDRLLVYGSWPLSTDPAVERFGHGLVAIIEARNTDALAGIRLLS